MYWQISTQNITINQQDRLQQMLQYIILLGRLQSYSGMSKLQINLKYFEAVLSKKGKQKRPYTTFLPTRPSRTITQSEAVFTASMMKVGNHSPLEMRTNFRSPSSSQGLRSVRCTSFNRGRQSKYPNQPQCKLQVLNRRCYKRLIQQQSKPSNKIDFHQILSPQMKGKLGEQSNRNRKESYHQFQSKKLCSIRNKNRGIVRQLPDEEGKPSLSNSLRISILSLKTY